MRKALWHRKNQRLVLKRKVWNFVGAFTHPFCAWRGGMKNRKTIGA
jgi:hypothetical protein